MRKVLLKRIPRRTDKTLQRKVLYRWARTMTTKYSTPKDIPVVSAKEYISSISN